MIRTLASASCLALAACATTPEPAPQSRAQALAALLVETERTDPMRLASAEPELSALERALRAAPEPEPVAEAEPTPLAPPPALAGAQSLMHAVHVASYREHRHAVSGWAELTARHPALQETRPRLQRVDLGDRGVFLRLKAGPFTDAESARSACAAIEASGEWCQVLDFTGEPL
ncbi:MAG: hypothetical protein ABL308_13510 [Oceanicaulis sp.]